MNTRLRNAVVMAIGMAGITAGAWYWQQNRLPAWLRLEAQAREVIGTRDSSGKPALTVELSEPRLRHWPLAVPATGLIAPWQEAIIGAEAGGLRIASLEVDIGSQVRAGQVLAALASDSVDAELQRLIATQAAARAALAQARSNAGRAEIARAGEAISDQQYNDYQVAVQTALANLGAVEAQVATQRVVKAHTQIIAVDDGVITSRTAALGKVVQPGDELFRLIRKGRLEWQAEVDAREITRITPGQPAHLSLPGGASVDGRVRLAAPGLQSATGRGIIYVSLAPGSAARPGMYANGHIELATTDALAVPQSAVVVSDGMNYLFELQPDHHVTRRKVDVGRRRAGEVEILHGIAPGAAIVLDGGAFLGDGDLVQVSRAGSPS